MKEEGTIVERIGEKGQMEDSCTTMSSNGRKHGTELLLIVHLVLGLVLLAMCRIHPCTLNTEQTFQIEGFAHGDLGI